MADGRARTLRKNQTDAERRLWRSLRLLKHHGLHFRRQAPIGNYIVDFVCHRAKLVIELDGGQHGEPKQMQHDAVRTQFLESIGYRVHRFWNAETFRREADIAEYVCALATLPPTRSGCADSSPDRPPLAGGGKVVAAPKKASS